MLPDGDGKRAVAVPVHGTCAQRLTKQTYQAFSSTNTSVTVAGNLFPVRM